MPSYTVKHLGLCGTSCNANSSHPVSLTLCTHWKDSLQNKLRARVPHAYTSPAALPGIDTVDVQTFLTGLLRSLIICPLPTSPASSTTTPCSCPQLSPLSLKHLSTSPLSTLMPTFCVLAQPQLFAFSLKNFNMPLSSTSILIFYIHVRSLI